MLTAQDFGYIQYSPRHVSGCERIDKLANNAVHSWLPKVYRGVASQYSSGPTRQLLLRRVRRERPALPSGGKGTHVPVADALTPVCPEY
jgi:hypothetical protein